MKKHFLLLMLMALLPLAGWAEATDISTATVTLNRTELNYTGKATAPVIKSVVVGQDALTETTHYTVGYKDSEGTPIEASKVRNAGSYKLVLTGDGFNYSGTVETAFSINPGEVHLNVISPSKEYGAADPTELEYTWVDKSQIVGDDDVNSVVFTWTLAREVGEDIATYKYTTCEATTPNYNVVIDNAASATLKITKVKLTMTLISGALNRTFGDAQKEATIANFDATGLKGEDNLESLFGTSKKFGYKTDDNNAGDNKKITFDTVENANYDVEISGTLNISPKTLNKADLTIGAYGPVTYKAAEYAPEISVSITEGNTTLVQGEDYTLNKGNEADFKKAGTQNVTIAFIGNYADGDNLVNATSFVINQKTLYVYPSSGSSDYEGTSVDANAVSTVQFNGLEGEDKDTEDAKKIVVTSQNITNAGDYTLTVTVPDDNPLKENYVIKKVNGKWTVNKLALTITAPTSSHVYGNEVVVPTLSTTNTTMKGAIESDKEGIISDLTVAVEGVDAKTKVGTIENAVVLAAKAEVSKLQNYNYVLNPADYTVTSAAYTVIAQNVNIIYGETPKFTFINGTGAEVKDVKFTLKKGENVVELADAKNVGDYTIIIDKSSITVPDNYDKEFTTVTGTLNIAAKNLTIKPKAQKLPVGSTAGDLSTYDINNSMVDFVGGLVGEDKIAYELGFATISGMLDAQKKLQEGTFESEWTADTKTWTGGIKVSAPAEINAEVYANANYDITWAATADITVSSTLELTLDSNNEALLDIIDAANGKQADVKFAQSKKLVAGRWNTLVLPFATTVKAVSETLGYAVVDMLDVTNTSAEKVSLKLAFGAIPANTAFLVQPSDEIDLNTVTFEGVTISNANIDEDGLATGAKDAANHSLMGSYIKDGYFVTSKNTDEFYYSPSLKQFVNSKKEDGTMVAVFGAFLRAANANGARITTIDIQEPDGTTTSIKTVESAERNVEGWYNLNGVKIAEPTQKGIYIHNGKKVVIK